jgi:hypothetical protein
MQKVSKIYQRSFKTVTANIFDESSADPIEFRNDAIFDIINMYL